MARDIQNLQQIFDHIAKLASEQERVSLKTVVETIGRRSFGPLLLLVGIILTSPLSGIPGMPTTMSIFVILIAVQLLSGRKHFWLPQWLLRRSVSGDRINKALRWLQPKTRFIDRWVRPRLTFLVRSVGTHLIAIVCLIIALLTPVMELVPFSATIAGLALTTFGLSLVAQDGLLVLIALTFAAVTLGWIFLP